MRKFISFSVLMLNLLIGVVGYSQDTTSIGNGTSNIHRYPFYGLYDYSHSMFIYTDTEMGGSAVTLEKIQFDLGGYSTPYTYNNITIKLAHTTDEEFGTNVKVDLTNLNYSDLTTVLSGYNLTISSSGWVTFTFTTTFDYNGVDNLLVIVENHDGSWSSGYGYAESEFDNCSCTNEYMSWYKHADDSYPTGYGTRDQSYRPNIKAITETTLPIELLSFDVKDLGENLLVEWIVSTQINNDYFVLLYSQGGSNWLPITYINGNGNTTDVMEYEFIHDNVKPGENYYMLKQVDYDGRYELFGPITFNRVSDNKRSSFKDYNYMGQEVNYTSSGFIIRVWDNGDVEKLLIK